MIKQEFVIALDDDHAPDVLGPSYDGDRDAPVWALKAVTAPLDEDWGLKVLGEGMTYQQAMMLARELGYAGDPIGPARWPDES